MKTKFVIVSASGYWGAGETLKEAALNCIKSGSSKSDKNICCRLYTGEQAALDEIRVVGMGEISFPPSLQSFRVFGSKTGISLGQLSKDVEPK